MRYDAHNEVACLILGSMTPELQRQLKNSSPYEMLQELKFMFENQAGVEIYVLPQDLCVGLILNGLTSDFVGFIRNYNKHNMGKTIGELHALLIEYEKGKGKGKGNGKDKSYIPKPKNPNPFAKEHPTKDEACHRNKEVGHCNWNYPAYLAELIKKKKQVGTAISLDIFTIELFSFPNKSWVYDTGCEIAEDFDSLSFRHVYIFVDDMSGSWNLGLRWNEVQFRRTSLTRLPAQSIRSSNAIALDSPYLLVLITRTSQSRHHGKSESDSYYLSDCVVNSPHIT
ncbi:hypothetical protein Tco_0245421 [Tanacetum coccineum]